MAHSSSPREFGQTTGTPHETATNNVSPLAKFISATALAVASICGTAACGGSSTENNYGVESQKLSITVETLDQFGNPVDGKILYNGEQIGIRSAELRYAPSQAGTLSFDDNLPEFDSPGQVDLQSKKLIDGDRLEGVYVRTGNVANICPNAIGEQDEQIDADLSVNGHKVDHKAGHCQSVNTKKETNINSGNLYGPSSNQIYIPPNKLAQGETYHYNLRFQNADLYTSVATTPVSGEIFANGESLGWAKTDFVSVPIKKDQPVEVSFGEESWHLTPEPFTINFDDIDQTNGDSYHFWGLYDRDINALVCFQGSNSGNKTDAKVLVDDEIKLQSGWDFPACVGLETDSTHTAEFQKTSNYMSNDVLEISEESHIGCEGEFVPGSRLDCTGEYYYVEPEGNRTYFSVSIKATAPLLGNQDYPVSARYEINGIDYINNEYYKSLEIDEKMKVTFQPLGILSPDPAVLEIDSDNLSVDDTFYNPETDRWEYTVKYTPPTDAVESCITSFNQNGANISREITATFDGFNPLNSYDENTDCHWFAPLDNHVITPQYLNGYYPAVNQIYIPNGQITTQNQFEMPWVPYSTYHQLCVQNITGEYPLNINDHELGWTSYGEKCVWLNKDELNLITIEGVGSISYIKDDPDLAGSSSTIDFSAF